MTTPFTDPPAAPEAPGTAPVRTDRSTFATRADAAWAWLFSTFWPWFLTFISWFTTFKAELSAYSVGYIYGLRYTFSATTAAADPGAGTIRLNHADVTLATALYISETDADAANQGPNLATWDDGAQALKGLLRIVKGNDTAVFVEYQVSGARVDGGAWNTFNLTYLNHNGAIAGDDPVVLVFQGHGADGADAEFTSPTRTVAASGAITSADNGYLLDVTAAGVTLTLDSAAALGAGWSCMLLESAYSVTLSGDFNDGTASKTALAGSVWMLSSDGTKHRATPLGVKPTGTVLQEVGYAVEAGGSTTSTTMVVAGAAVTFTPKSAASKLDISVTFEGRQGVWSGNNPAAYFALYVDGVVVDVERQLNASVSAGGLSLNAPCTLTGQYTNASTANKSISLRLRTSNASSTASALNIKYIVREVQA